jgi:ABC-2 type transport system permease protein
MNLKSALTWSFWVVVLIFVFLSIFSSMDGGMDAFNSILKNYPPELRAAFGMDGLDMSSLLGFFSFAIMFCQIIVSIQAANYGFSLVSVEERDLTADFLLAKPVGRTKILTAKFLAAISSLAITNAVVWIASFVFLNVYKAGQSYDRRTLILLLLTITFLQLFFLSVGALVSLCVKKIRSVTPYSMGIVFGLYILNAFGGTMEDDMFSYLTPFKHFEANQIIKNGSFNTNLVMISVVVIILSFVGSYVLYQRRDIHSV